MKTATAPAKKKDKPSAMPKVCATLQFEPYLTLYQKCPSCGEDATSPVIREGGFKFIETPCVCKECGTAMVVFEPAPPAAEDPVIGPEDFFTKPSEAEDPVQPPVTGAGEPPADETIFHPSRFNAPLFGMTEKDIDEVVEGAVNEVLNPKFPVIRTAFLSAGIVLALMVLLVAAAWYWGIPIRVLRLSGPQPMSVWGVDDSGTLSPFYPPKSNTMPAPVQQAIVTTTICPEGKVCKFPPFGFALTMNEDAWVEVTVDGKESLPGRTLKKGANHIWFDVDRVSVRCGKPGAIQYFVNGKPVTTPPNSADKPDKVEVVTLTAGMYPKEQ